MDESGELTEPMEEVPFIGVVDEEKQEVDSRDEGKHTAMSDLLFVDKMMSTDGRASVTKDVPKACMYYCHRQNDNTYH